MSPRGTYIVVALIGAVAMAALLFIPSVRGRSRGRLTPLAAVAFVLVVAGIAFGDERWLGYGLIGSGVVLAIVDAVWRARRS
ncbi:MAG: hypothetical protein P1P87_11095 [Trueperaceae bacterium]|nr:hypothetical protein [Trueperaceae bacterium]